MYSRVINVKETLQAVLKEFSEFIMEVSRCCRVVLEVAVDYTEFVKEA